MGAALVIAAIIGFFYSSDFGTGEADVLAGSDEIFGILAVNGWHNLIGHLAIGLLLLAAAGSASREAALGVGLLYLVLAIWGFLIVDDGFGVILGLIPVNTEDNFLHLILGLTGLAAGAATPTAVRAPAAS